MGVLGQAMIRSGLGAARYRLTGHRMPLAVTLQVTHHCDALCRVCSVPLQHREELSTSEWVDIIDTLGRLGTVRVGFSGGEPLVREDLGVLVDRCSSHGIWTTLETNGYRYPERRGELGTLGRVMIGLDGREAAHDAIREPGAWKKAQRAVDAAAEDEVDRWTTTTLTRHNLDDIGWILDEAERKGFTAAFQLLLQDRTIAPASVSRLAPTNDQLRKALRTLIEARAAGRRVGVSEKLLRYLLTWDDFRVTRSDVPHEDVHCVAGQLHCSIGADGTVLPCPLLAGRFPGTSARGGNFELAFEKLRDNACRACTSTPLTEYNFLYNLNAPALFEWGRAIGKGLATPRTP
jgi:MoaA/NifB/PqqE/SkfB family radical SAM enzyme